MGTNVFLVFFTLPGIFLMSFAATADAFLNALITLTLISLYKYSQNKKPLTLTMQQYLLA